MPSPTISCIFPVHNEKKILTETITNFISQWKTHRLPKCEIILIENGSSDNSWKKILKLKKRFHHIKSFHLEHASYGQALKLGMQQSRGHIIFIFNVDFYDLQFAQQALHLLKVADIVIGSKTLSASRDERSQFRRLTTYFFNVLLRLVLNYPGTDTHGIKAFRNTPLLSYSINRCRTRNELFDTELIIRMTRWEAKLLEIPITVREIRATRYTLGRRLWLTSVDLLVAFWGKYLRLPYFEKKVVVADDYGLSKTANEEILNTVDKQEVQYVSILANMVTPIQARTLLQRRQKVKFSAHLNLVEGKPSSSPKKIPTLVNGQQQFYSLPQFLTRLLIGLINVNEIKIEWVAQINRLKQLGFTFNHIDSHQHTHVFPPLWNLSLQKANNWGINYVRSQDSTRYALQSQPFKYTVYLLFVFVLTARYGFNHSSPKEMNEIIIHPGANY